MSFLKRMLKRAPLMFLMLFLFILTGASIVFSGSIGASGTLTLGDLNVGDKVIDPAWQWEYRTGDGYEGGSVLTRPVPWIVVANDHPGYPAESVTLLSEYLVASHHFAQPSEGWENGKPHWFDSCLRAWLNSTFYGAFSDGFKAAVIPTTLTTEYRDVQGGAILSEQSLNEVFLLSIREMGHFLDHEGPPMAYFDSSEKRKAFYPPGIEHPDPINIWNSYTRTQSHYDPNWNLVYLVQLGNGEFALTRAELPRQLRPAVNLPASIRVSATPNAEGYYEIQEMETGTGTLTITINPEAAGDAGAKWSIDGGTTWQDNGDSLSLQAGSYLVTYREITGYSTPGAALVEVLADQNTTHSGTYSIHSYAIAVFAVPEEGGTVSGEGAYDYGEEVTVSALVNSGYTFVNWTENGIEVFDQPVYTFTAEADRALTANFFEGGVYRLSGPNRYITAVKISQDGWESANTVVLARGDDFADALAGVPLAYHLDAPILLTRTDRLVEATKDEINRLNAQHVILLGGTGAISDAVGQDLENLGLIVERIAGANRYATAVLIAEKLKDAGADFDTAFIAVGTNFADALAASSYAAIRGEPILLVQPNRLPNATAEALSDESLGIVNTKVCGGVGAVSEEVFALLPNPERFSGQNRYETAVALAEEFLPDGTKHLGIATGLHFPDAISGGVLAAKRGIGILLVRGDRTTLPESLENFLAGRDISRATILGGTGAVSEGIEERLLELLE